MVELQFSIKIKASRKKVWAALWEEESFRSWAAFLDEGMYLKGEMKEGNEIQFLSSVNGLGVTSLIERLENESFIQFRHSSDTQENGAQEREKEWTGGRESYTLTEQEGETTLTIIADTPEELQEVFAETFPKAMNRIRELAEDEKPA